MLSRKWLLILGTLLSQGAYPIGRTGNSDHVSDPIDGYTTEVPKTFTSMTKLKDGNISLDSGLFAGDNQVPISIYMSSFRSQYPALVSKGREQIERFFLNTAGISYLKLGVTNGSLTLLGEADSSYVGVSVCNDGRGFILYASKLEIVNKGMHELLLNTVFEKPCSQ